MRTILSLLITEKGGGIYWMYVRWMRKKLRSWLVISDLNLAVDDAETNCWGREFHIGTIRDKKKYFLVLVLAMGTTSLKVWPLVEVFGEREKKSLNDKAVNPRKMLKQRIKSNNRRWCSKLWRWSGCKRSAYDLLRKPGRRLVKDLWIPSIASIRDIWYGDQIWGAYSTRGRT